MWTCGEDTGGKGGIFDTHRGQRGSGTHTAGKEDRAETHRGKRKGKGSGTHRRGTG